MGTSIIAVTFNGGVILGADSRTSTGSYVANRVADKASFCFSALIAFCTDRRAISTCMQITPLSDNVYILRSGSAADTQAISSYVQLCESAVSFSSTMLFVNASFGADIAQHQSEEGEQISVKVAAKLAAHLAYENKDNLQAGLIIAGWDKHAGGSVYGIPLGGTIIPAPYAMGGSGSAYIYGFCDKVRVGTIL